MAKHATVVDLEGEKATRERFIGTLEKKSPRFVFLNGHGNENVVCGHDDEILLKESDVAVKDKILYARACKSAKQLGQKAIENGASAYIGYDEDFIFTTDETKSSRPVQDETAALFLEPSNQTAISILKGHTAEEANRRSKEKFAKNIRTLLLLGPSEDDYYAIRYLLWDMRHQVCLGDGSSKF
ncbi:MAG: hypothetical protein HYW56_00515 [Candidatus Harrisonbacteria bacterium]|nr:hypothetical protein [Candidatus Harrisonbacteria bacterium]